MEAWKGIPAHYIAKQLTALRRGSDFSGCSKDLMAQMFEHAGDDAKHDSRFLGATPESLAELARADMAATQARTSSMRTVAERARLFADRLKIPADVLHAAYRALALSEAGQKVVLAPGWAATKERLRAQRRRDYDRADRAYYNRMLEALERALEK